MFSFFLFKGRQNWVNSDIIRNECHDYEKRWIKGAGKANGL